MDKETITAREGGAVPTPTGSDMSNKSYQTAESQTGPIPHSTVQPDCTKPESPVCTPYIGRVGTQTIL